MPRTRQLSDHEELIEVDGKSFTRKLPKVMTVKERQEKPSSRCLAASGARDVSLRLADLDREGIWAEVMYQSIGMWSSLIEDRKLIAEAARAKTNGWYRRFRHSRPIDWSRRR